MMTTSAPAYCRRTTSRLAVALGNLARSQRQSEKCVREPCCPALAGVVQDQPWPPPLPARRHLPR